MAVILAQTATGTSNLASTVVSFGNPNTNGNTIVVCVANTAATSGDVSGVTDTQGNIYSKVVAATSGLSGDLELWYTSGIAGGANTVTVAYTTGVSCAVIVREYWGLLQAGTLDKQNSAAATSTAPNSGNVQLVQPIELLIGLAMAGAGAVFTAGAGFGDLATLQDPNNLVELAIEDQFVTSIGPWAATFSLGSSTLWTCAIGSFYQLPRGTTTSTSFTTSTSSTSTSISSTSTSVSSTSTSISTSSTSTSMSLTTISTSSTSTSQSSTSQSSTSSSTSISSTSTSFSSTSSSVSSTSSSVSSTSISSTSSSISTSTTTLPPPYFDYTYQDEGPYIVTQVFGVTAPAEWICPQGVTSVFAECWGGGGGGGGSVSGSVTGDNGGGGGGGAYANATVSVVAGTVYTVSVGAAGTGGTGGASPNAGGTGGNSSFVNASTVLAVGGGGGGAGSGAPGAAGTGGTAGSCVGLITISGSNGGAGSSTSVQGGGGGGGAGPGSSGSVGLNTGIAGSGGGQLGGIGGSGSNGGAGGAGNFPGGGAGGAGSSSGGSTGGLGGAGLIRLTYTINPTVQANNNDMSNLFNAAIYGQVSTNDGDYFIEKGSTNIVAQYKDIATNNSGNITVSWRGRTTIAPSTSPIYLQIYNYNTQLWETWGSQTVVGADTDFGLQATISANVANYYSSNNQVSARVYQQVI